MRLSAVLTAVLMTAVLAMGAPRPAAAADTYTQEEIVAKAKGFFGTTTKGLADAIQKVFEDQGKPNAIILGEEASGAIGIGLRYGNGTLERKSGTTQKVYWQGPSIGFDFGGNASKVFTLIYNLDNTEALFQRYPGVDGSFYVVAGLGVNYQQAGDVILAPIRTGVGLRAGASVGYLHYSKEHSWIPF
jgi:hypothetical protein